MTVASHSEREAASPLLVAVTAGEPFDPLARSGSNLHLFTALQRLGCLAGVVNARPRPVARLERLGAWSSDRELRRQRSDAAAGGLSPLARALMSRIGARRARAVHARPDALLQIGAWYDLRRGDGPSPRLRVSYHDGNLPSFLRRPDLRLDPDSPSVRRALAFERRVHAGLDLVLPRSDWLRRSFIEDFGLDERQVVVVGAGANLDEVPEIPDRDLRTPRLLFVGKDFHRKGGPQVVAAFERLRARRCDAELTIVGPTQAPAQGPGIRCVGRIARDSPAGEAQYRALLRGATMFVMPSLYEAWGIAPVEAMAFALPCIVARTCAMPEIVADGETGLLVPPGDVDALAGAFERLASDPVEARAMGEAGRRRYLDRFTWDRVAQRIASEIERRLTVI